jgi:hypothetical protein
MKKAVKTKKPKRQKGRLGIAPGRPSMANDSRIQNYQSTEKKKNQSTGNFLVITQLFLVLERIFLN